ncbi:hypothetical protein GCM10020331_011970 [Ectobacillus funiculus]
MIVDIDRYEWIGKGEVETTVMYYILEVLEPSPQYRRQQLGLKVVEKKYEGGDGN